MKTHAPKHLIEFLKLVVFEMNINPENNHLFLPSDINAVVDLIIKQKVIKPNACDPFKLNRCEDLYNEIMRYNKFPHIDLHDLLTNKTHWFKAMPLFLAMQREIEQYNLSQDIEDRLPWHPKETKKKENKKARKKRKPYVPKPKQTLHNPPSISNLAQGEEDQPPPQPKKKKKRKRAGKRKHAKKRKTFGPRRKQMLDDPNFPPSIKNLVVVPQCSYRRKHIQIGLSSMYRVLSSQKLLKRDETKQSSNIPENEFNAAKDQNWNKFFYMRKIRRFMHKKKFDYSFKTDGVSVSLHYFAKNEEQAEKKDKKKLTKEDKEREKEIRKEKEKQKHEANLLNIHEKLVSGHIVQLIGIDPGMRRWNTTVVHSIPESKEVCIVYMYWICFV